MLRQHRQRGAYLSTVTDNTLQLARLTQPGAGAATRLGVEEEIVGAVLARVRQRDPAAHQVQRARGPAAAVADPVLMAQLIDNLLDNALKYSDGRRLSWVSAEAQELVLSRERPGPGHCRRPSRPAIFEPYPARRPVRAARGAGLRPGACAAPSPARMAGDCAAAPRGRRQPFSTAAAAGSRSSRPRSCAMSLRVLLVEDDRELRAR